MRPILIKDTYVAALIMEAITTIPMQSWRENKKTDRRACITYIEQDYIIYGN